MKAAGVLLMLLALAGWVMSVAPWVLEVWG